MTPQQDNLGDIIEETVVDLERARGDLHRHLGDSGCVRDRPGVMARVKRIRDLEEELSTYEGLLGEIVCDAYGR